MKSILRNTTFAVMLCLGAVATMAMPTTTAQAAVPTDASLLRLIEVTKVVEQLNDMFNGNAADMTAQETLVPLADEAIEFHKIDDNEGLEYFNQLLMEAYKTAYIKVAKKHYNQQEINAQIDFYSSDIGQSLVSKQAVFTKDYTAEFEANIIRSMTQNNTFNQGIDTNKDIKTLISKE